MPRAYALGMAVQEGPVLFIFVSLAQGLSLRWCHHVPVTST